MPTCLRPCCSKALFDSFLPQRSRGRRTRTERGAGSEGVGSSMDGGGTGGQGGRTCWEATTTEVRRPECHSAASLWLESVFERRALIICCCREERSGWNDGPGTFSLLRLRWQQMFFCSIRQMSVNMSHLWVHNYCLCAKRPVVTLSCTAHCCFRDQPLWLSWTAPAGP